jgi:hypothetical protein
VINLVKKVAQNVKISMDYYIFLQLEASKSSPIDKKLPNLVTLDASESMIIATTYLCEVDGKYLM